MARYERDRRGIGMMLKSPGFAQLVHAAAEHGADAVRAAVPRDTGRLAASIHVEDDGVVGDRQQARVVADASHAAAVQWGNARVRAQPYMQAAIEAIEGPG